MAFEDDGQFEEAAWDFRGAEVAELRFEAEEVGEKFALGDAGSVVVDQESCGVGLGQRSGL